MAAPTLVVFGGNGTIGRLITKYALSKSWQVVSVIRDQRQEAGIRLLGTGYPKKLDVFLQNLSGITERQATELLNKTRPDYVVFAASDPRNYASVDCIAAKTIIKACVLSPWVSKFLIISFTGSRRSRAPWWDDRDWKEHLNEKKMLPGASTAKVQADEYLIAMAKAREKEGRKFQGISLRPSWFSSDGPLGKIQLGKTRAIGRITKGDVALTALSLLCRDDTYGWFDLVQGDQDIDEAIENAVGNSVNAIDGEDLERIYSLAD